jgi:hypothetical protein
MLIVPDNSVCHHFDKYGLFVGDVINVSKRLGNCHLVSSPSSVTQTVLFGDTQFTQSWGFKNLSHNSASRVLGSG